MIDRKTLVLSLLFAFVAIIGVSDAAHAQRRNDTEIRDALRMMSSKLDDFERNLRFQMQSSSAGSTQLDDVTMRIRSVRDAVRRFEYERDRRRETKNDANEIVNAARRVQEFMDRYPQNRQVEDAWKAVISQIDRLGSNYGLKPAWTSGEEPPQWVKDDPGTGNSTFSVGLSGTYGIDRERSERVEDVVSGVNASDDQRAELKDKLAPPDEIAIDIRGDRVTLATSNAAPVTFAADGRDKTEQDASGRTVRMRAALTGDSLTISTRSDQTDYTITFTSVSDGRAIKVSRRMTTDYLKQTLFAESTYNKTDAVARLGIPVTDAPGSYSDNDDPKRMPNGGSGSTAVTGPPKVTTRPGNYVVPNSTVLSGTLENEINTKVSQNNDRFRLRINSPEEFRGAVVEGYVSGVKNSGRVTGRSNITFNFERIILADGRKFDFAGNLQEIRNQDGRQVKIDNEGSAQGDSQTKETAKRSGIGAGIGAIIGAIAGGAKGAAIGAAIGGGAGAGSVIVTGKDDLRLLPGSTITVQSSSPNQ